MSHPDATPDVSDACLDDRPHLPGLALQRRREERGLSLDDLARTTKISKNVLRALEATDVAHLPAAIYTRGFVKAYAGEVALPPDETANDYLSAIAPLQSAHVQEDNGMQPPMKEAVAAVLPDGDTPEHLTTFQGQRFGRLALVAGAVGLVVYVASFRRGDAPAAPSRELAEIADVARAGGTAVDRGATDVPARTALTDAPLRVELTPQGPCWVQIRVGGETVLAKLLQAGDRERIDLTEEAVVRVGEPGALSYSINGQSGRALGPAGTPVTVRISKDNFREFLSS